jgi:hypothetical protein
LRAVYDNDPIIDFICKIPDAVDTEYNRKDIPNTVNLFYSKVNYILKGFAINSGLFSVKPEMPQGDAYVLDTIIVVKLYGDSQIM